MEQYKTGSWDRPGRELAKRLLDENPGAMDEMRKVLVEKLKENPALAIQIRNKFEELKKQNE